MILDQHGRVQPPDEIVRRLKQIDPRLGLTLSSTVDPANDRIRDAWAFTMDWLASDERHRFVQDGTIPPTHCFDVLSFLPFDMGVDEAYGYVVKTFKQLRDRDDVKPLLERVHTFNRERHREVMRETNELLDDVLETNKNSLIPGTRKAVSSPISQHKRETQAKKDKKLREYIEQ